MCRTIALANQKGGTGKTTSTYNLGHALAEKRQKVLMVDLDPQSSLTISLGIDPRSLEKTVYELLVETEPPTKTADVIVKTSISNLSLIPSTIDLSSAEIDLQKEFNREGILREVLKEVHDEYDFILVDCPPSLGLLTTNALAAANKIIIPIASDYLAMRGATLLIKTIRKVQRKLNPSLEIAGILVTMYDRRTVHAKDVLGEIREAFGDSVFKSVINYTVKAKEAPVDGQSILSYQPSSPIAQAYRSLAEEILNHE